MGMGKIRQGGRTYNRTGKYTRKRNLRIAGRKLLVGRSPATKYRNNAVMGLGFPKKLVMTHKYSEIIQVTSTAPTPAVYQYSCNSLYDPNSTGTGHQPYYFDQLSAIYDHYVVIGSKAVIRICPTVNTSGAIVTSYINDDTTQITNNPPYSAEYSSAKTQLLAPGFTKPVYIVMKWSAKKAFGGSILSNTELQGTPSANPSEQQYYTVQMTDSSYANNLLFNIYIQVEYTAVWKELKDISSS